MVRVMLVEAGVPEEKVIGISQGWKLGGAIKTAERKLAKGGKRPATSVTIVALQSAPGAMEKMWAVCCVMGCIAICISALVD